MGTNMTLKKRGDEVIVGSYARYPAAMIQGQGCRLTDADGKPIRKGPSFIGRGGPKPNRTPKAERSERPPRRGKPRPQSRPKDRS